MFLMTLHFWPKWSGKTWKAWQKLARLSLKERHCKISNLVVFFYRKKFGRLWRLEQLTLRCFAQMCLWTILLIPWACGILRSRPMQWSRHWWLAALVKIRCSCKPFCKLWSRFCEQGQQGPASAGCRCPLVLTLSDFGWIEEHCHQCCHWHGHGCAARRRHLARWADVSFHLRQWGGPVRRSCLASATWRWSHEFLQSLWGGAKKLLPNVTPVFSWSPQHCLFAVCSPFPGVHLHVVYVWLELSGFLGERFLCCSSGTERQDGWAGSGNAFVFFPLYILRWS